MEKPNEETITASSYILNFYNEVGILTSMYANYQNALLEMSEKKKAGGNLEEQDKQVFKDLNVQIRYYVNMSYIKYSSIILKTGGQIDKAITDLRVKICCSIGVGNKDVEKYVIAMNGVLMQTVIKSLLQNSSDIINKLYSENGSV